MDDKITAPFKKSSDQDFAADVIEASAQLPIVVEFWAPGCAGCKQIEPALEKAVLDTKGKLALVKINIYENPHIARSLRIRTVPTVIAFRQGRPVGAFQGARPASELNEFVRSLIGDDNKAQAQALQDAQEAFDAGDTVRAAQIYAILAQQEPENVKAIAGLARCYLANGDIERCRQTMAMIAEANNDDPDIQMLASALELADAALAHDEAASASRLKAEPDDLSARYELAAALAGRLQYQSATEQLFHIIDKSPEWNNGSAKALLLQIFTAAGVKSRLVEDGRRRLAAMLFK